MSDIHKLSPHPMHDLVCKIGVDAVSDAAHFVYHSDLFDLDYFRAWSVSVDVRGVDELDRLGNLVRIISRHQHHGFQVKLQPQFNDADELRSFYVVLESTFVERYFNTKPVPLVEITVGWFHPQSIAECVVNADTHRLAENYWAALMECWTWADHAPVSFDDAIVPHMTLKDVVNES